MNKKPVGIFDSGIGGLTVAREVFRHLPNEDVIYFGDTARVPYGTKGYDTIRKFSFSDMKFLAGRDIKLAVVACNTTSATSLEYLRRKFPRIPVIGVIKPAVALATICTRNRKIGIIGTESTISSGTYAKEIKKVSGNISVFGQACPLFVPLVEEGWTDCRETSLIVSKYLQPLKKKGIDTIILGCTHYPLLTKVIAKVMGKNVAIINSAGVVAEECREVLKEMGLLNEGRRKGTHKFFVSDNPQKFKRVGEKFLGHRIGSVSKVDIDKYMQQ